MEGKKDGGVTNVMHEVRIEDTTYSEETTPLSMKIEKLKTFEKDGRGGFNKINAVSKLMLSLGIWHNEYTVIKTMTCPS